MNSTQQVFFLPSSSQSEEETKSKGDLLWIKKKKSAIKRLRAWIFHRADFTQLDREDFSSRDLEVLTGGQRRHKKPVEDDDNFDSIDFRDLETEEENE